MLLIKQKTIAITCASQQISPMGHVHVQDVLRRPHPQVDISRFGLPDGLKRMKRTHEGEERLLDFGRFTTRGRTLARHVGIELVVPRPFGALRSAAE